MIPVLITAPTIEPITVAEFKAHKRLDFFDEDFLIEGYISAARGLFEELTGRTLHQTEWEVAFDGFPYGSGALELPMATPLLSITHVKYVDSDGVETTWGSSGYVLDTYGLPGLVAPAYGVTWPSFTPYPFNPVRIRYIAGIPNGSPQLFPSQMVRQTIREMTAGLYDNREHVTVTDRLSIAAFAINPVTQLLIENCKVKRVY